MIYLDTSVALAQLLAEERIPPRRVGTAERECRPGIRARAWIARA